MAAPPPSHSHPPPRERERVGDYLLGSEIGRGSFATVLRGYKAASREVVAIKVVQRAKMTSKLLENLEAEITILKAIHHPNIVGLEDCLKLDERIYLIMDYCSGGDLSFYIKKRGRLPTLEYVPPEGGPKRFWLHPEEGGLDEVVVKCFLGQLTSALKFLRSQNLIHRDIKPQNLLLQPPSTAEIEAGHPIGIPILKVADFGFARFLEGASMAETLCGSPLYMAPEILRYEKYDAKADLWSVGTVLYEMSVGRPPFKAQNHVELLKKIERGEDHIRFPDEKSSWNPISVGSDGAPVGIPQQPVGKDVKALIKRLLKRNPVQRISFADFFRTDIAAAYQEHMNRSGADETIVSLPQPPPSMMPNASTPPAPSELPSRVAAAGRLISRAQPPSTTTTRTIPIATRPAPSLPPFALPLPASPPVGESPLLSTPPISASPISRAVHTSSPLRASPPPLPTTSSSPAAQSPALGQRPRLDSGLGSSQGKMTRQPSFEPRYVLGQIASRSSVAGEPSQSEPRRASAGSQARPVLRRQGSTTASSSVDMFEYEEDEAGQDYVVIEKRTVEINSLADELDAASQRNVSPVARRRSSRSLLSRPLSALTLSRPNSAISGSSPPVGGGAGGGPSTSPQSVNSFALSITPPFAISSSPSRPSPLHHMHSHASHTSSLTRPISIPHSPASFSSLSGRPTPQHVGSAGSPLGIVASAPQQRYGSSPSSGGVLARAISLASARLFGGPTSASIAAAGAGVVARASARRKALIQSGEADPAEESLINQLEDLAQKAFVVFEFADTKVGAILSAASGVTSGLAGTPVGPTSNNDSPGSASSSGFPQLSQSPAIAQSQAFQRRRSSFNSTSESEASFFRLDVVAAEALALYLKSLAFLQKGMEAAKNFWQARDGGIEASADLNEVVQWFRARFNDCSDKAEFARGRCTEEPSDVSALAERLLYEKAMDLWRNAAIQEALSEDPIHTERAYDTAVYLFKAILDDTIRDGQLMEEEDRMSVEKFVAAAQKRLESVRKRMSPSSAASSLTTPSSFSPPSSAP